MKRDDVRFEAVSVDDLFQFKSHFLVPEYQRNYSWTGVEVAEFLDDVQKASKTDDDYLMGQILLCPNSEERPKGLPRNVSSFEIVDGQQRLTTMYLAILMLISSIQEDWVRDQGSGPTSNWDHWRSLRLLPNEDDSEKPILKVSSSYISYDYWQAMLNGLDEPPESDTVSENNLDEARSAIRDHILGLGTNEKRYEFLNYLMHRVSIMKLWMPNSRDALQMFMNLNNKGMRLDPSDILKAHFFKKADRDDYGVLSQAWGKAQDNLLGQKKVKLITSMQTLLRMVIQAKTGDYIGNDELFARWEEYLGNDEGLSERVRRETEELPEKAKHLVLISKSQVPKTGASISELRGIQVVRAHSTYEILLAGSHLEEASFRTLTRVVEARTVLHSFSKFAYNLYEPKIHPWAEAVSSLDSMASREDILRASKKALNPSDIEEMVKELPPRIGQLKYGAADSMRIRYLLSRVNAFVQQKFNVTPHNVDALMVTKTDSRPDGYEIDHIFPKANGKREFWQSSPSQDDLHGTSDRSTSILNSVGNLALLKGSDNQFSNDSLPSDQDKLDAYAMSELRLCQLLHPEKRKELFDYGPHKKILDDLGWPNGLSMESWGEDSALELLGFYVSVFTRSLLDDLQ